MEQQQPGAAPPPLPHYNLDAIMALRAKLSLAALGHMATVVAGEAFDDFVAELAGAAEAPQGAVRQSILGLSGRELTDPAMTEIAWRLAGNIRRLRAGRPVHRWSVQEKPEWCPFRVQSIQFGYGRRGDAGAHFNFQAWAGSICPLVVRRFWSRAQYSFVASRIGFRWGRTDRTNRPFGHASHFTGLFFYGLVEPRLSKEHPGFHQVRVSQTMELHNTELILARLERPCPVMGYEHPCERCVKGQDQCPVAVHPLTYVPDDCSDCGGKGVPFDPADPLRCVACAHQKLIQAAPAS